MGGHAPNTPTLLKSKNLVKLVLSMDNNNSNSNRTGSSIISSGFGMNTNRSVNSPFSVLNSPTNFLHSSQIIKLPPICLTPGKGLQLNSINGIIYYSNPTMDIPRIGNTLPPLEGYKARPNQILIIRNRTSIREIISYPVELQETKVLLEPKLDSNNSQTYACYFDIHQNR